MLVPGRTERELQIELESNFMRAGAEGLAFETIVASGPSGVLRGRETPEPGFSPLRVDLPLEPGFAMTVEPGVYFVPAILADAANRDRHRQTVDWDRVECMLGFGGIRIEDNVLVTDDGSRS
jgi:Xaa-Pro aminopeptidase